MEKSWLSKNIKEYNDYDNINWKLWDTLYYHL